MLNLTQPLSETNMHMLPSSVHFKKYSTSARYELWHFIHSDYST